MSETAVPIKSNKAVADGSKITISGIRRGYTTGRTLECGSGAAAVGAVAARVPLAGRAQGSEIVDVGWRKTATVYRVPPSLTGREV